MDFEQLRIFVVLAEEGTYLGAANRLETSRSRVRRKLDQLEADAGTPLVIRVGGSLQLTPAGEVLLRRGRALIEDADRLVSQVREVGTLPTGCLKIAMPTGPPLAGWDQLRKRLQTRFPELQIELFFAESPTALLPAQAEIALSYDAERPPGCRSIEICTFPMRLFASDLYLQAHGLPRTLADLVHHRIAMWRSLGRARGELPLQNGQRLRLTPQFVTDEPTLLSRMAIEGDYIVYMPEFPAFIDPALKTLFADEVVGKVEARLTIPNVLADLPRIQQFVELAQRTIFR